MAISSDALFSNLLEDLSPWLTGVQIDKLLRKEKIPLDVWADTRNAAAVSLVNSFYAKYVDMCDPAAEDRAYSKFASANERCERYSLSDNICTTWDDELIGDVKSIIYRLLYPKHDSTFELYEILSEARDGPGGSLSVVGCDSYSKTFASRGSTTNIALHEYRKYFYQHDSRWNTALEFRQSHFGDPELVEGSKLSFVPKNRDTMRSICVEPSLNMYYQLGLGRLLEKRLAAYSGICLDSQPDLNRELARLGSINSTYCTIDLASASDTISWSLVKAIFPEQFSKLLGKLRCGSTFYKGKKIALHMVSTMGNGFTFPLQTILFLACVLAVYKQYGKPIVFPKGGALGNLGVFGDDIICLAEMYRPVTRLLGLLGFTVNAAKSFHEGPFRESCGEDYFNGVNIRGVYVERLNTLQDATVLVNRLNEFTARTGISVCNAMAYLFKKFRFNPVPMEENDDSGVKVPLSLVNHLKRDRHVQAIKYHRWVAQPVYMTVGKDCESIKVPRSEKRRIVNQYGLLLSFLQGGLRQYKIPVRIDWVTYRRRTALSPRWDYLPSALGLRNPAYQGRRLHSAVEANLYWLATP
jgi:hypothetical protein